MTGVVAAAAAAFFIELAIIVPGALFGPLPPGFRYLHLGFEGFGKSCLSGTLAPMGCVFFLGVWGSC